MTKKTEKIDVSEFQDHNLEKVVSFLSNPDAFNDGTSFVDVMSTHGSLVFLGKHWVYKIKRPVKYAYMDFTTLEKRKANCLREYELNKSIAPDLYLGVSAITREKNKQLMIDGTGTPIEWAVKMKRFEEEAVLYNIASKDEFSNQLALQLGERLAVYHRGLQPLLGHDGTLDIMKVIEQVEQFFLSTSSHIDKSLFNDCINQLKTAYLEVRDDLDKRAQAGFVRRCHGDLHLKNIVLIDGVPTPFDALEFDERLAIIDVIYDLSFLLMDLLSLDLKHLANMVLQRYLLKAWPLVGESGLRILPFCLALRAAIRAMVACQMEQIDQPLKQEKQAEAERYLVLASKVLKKTDPVLIAIGGLSGTGKSTLAQNLLLKVANPLGAVLLRSDLERKHLLGVSEFERLASNHYTPEMSKMVYKTLFEKASHILSAGQSVVIDAVFLSKDERRHVQKIGIKQNVPFCGLYLTAPLPVLLSRVTARKHDASDADAKVVKKQYERQPEGMENKDADWQFLDASGNRHQTTQLATAALRDRKMI